jgi:hypothetical protein
MSLWICVGVLLRRVAMRLIQIRFEPFVMSIILGQQERIRKLEKKLQTIQPDTATPSTGQEPKETDLAEPKITIPTATNGGGQTRFR